MRQRSSILRPLLAALLALAGPGLFGAEAPVAPAAAPGAAAEYRPPDDWHDILRLDREMVAFFEARVPRFGGLDERLDAIVAAILDRDGLGFAYREDGDYAARETFRRREGNCVAFSLLVVAMAREFRLTARFNEVRTEPRWERLGAVVAELRHLNVVVRGDSGTVMVDLLPPPGPGVALIATNPVSDAHAFAMFYSNIGVQRLGQGRLTDALPLLGRATAIAPGYAEGWVNLGNACLRAGESGRAKECFDRALKAEPRNLKALVGLAQLCRATGEVGRAQELERRTERFRLRNPFYLLQRARVELAGGDAASADRLLRRAIAIKDDEPEFYELGIEVANRLGDTRDASRWSERLQRLRVAVKAQP